jgi:hypothetical protein
METVTPLGAPVPVTIWLREMVPPVLTPKTDIVDDPVMPVNDASVVAPVFVVIASDATPMRLFTA